MERQFNLYDENYNNKSLEKIVPLKFSNTEKGDILGLYSYKSKAIQDLKIKLTTTENNRIINTCQSCTIGEVNSLDHILPKEMFAEFAVNPRNLLPCCTKCNSYKLNSWLEGGERIFLNLFLDELPNEQYLFVNTLVEPHNIQADFVVGNKSGIVPELYRIIESHYRRLYLCKRFSENISEVVTALDNSIIPYVDKLGQNDIIAATKEKISKDRVAFGSNYWKSLLELSLIENEDYLKRLFRDFN